MSDPTLRELRATLSSLWYEIDNHGGEKRYEGRQYRRYYDHMAFLLDAFLFDVDTSDDEGGRDEPAPSPRSGTDS